MVGIEWTDEKQENYEATHHNIVHDNKKPFPMPPHFLPLIEMLLVKTCFYAPVKKEEANDSSCKEKLCRQCRGVGVEMRPQQETTKESGEEVDGKE